MIRAVGRQIEPAGPEVSGWQDEPEAEPSPAAQESIVVAPNAMVVESSRSPLASTG